MNSQTYLTFYHIFRFLLKSKSINLKYTWLILEYIMINRNDLCLEYLENFFLSPFSAVSSKLIY